MNPDQALKLQAYLDGELSEREARQVADWLTQDSDGRMLLEELKMVSTTVAANEPELKLPESREFFWSKIEREIARQEPQTRRVEQPVPVLSWLHRYLVPISAAALVAFLGVLAISQSRQTSPLGEIESLNEDMASISFRSESDKMTVIYLYDRPQTGAEWSDYAPLE